MTQLNGIVNRPLSAVLQVELEAQLWQDDLRKAPRYLYPDYSTALLFEQWQRECNLLFQARLSAENGAVSLFAPVQAQSLLPRYLAHPRGRWYAVTALRYNRRTQNRFCYLRYWHAADEAALREMVQAVLAAWQAVPFEALKLRLGWNSRFEAADVSPGATVQNYVVGGLLREADLAAALAQLPAGGLSVQQPNRVTPAWWEPYRRLLDEQEKLAPGLMDDWRDYPAAVLELEREMRRLLAQGGGVINLWRDDALVGHISWCPDRYRDQLIWRCWHINNVIVRADHRRQGLGHRLHLLAGQAMNLKVSPIVAGLIAGGNQASLKTAAKLGRQVVDRYVIVPKP